MEQGAAPAGAGLTWLCALGRLRGTARRALGPGCEELADGWGDPHREARPGAEQTPRWSAARRSSSPHLLRGTKLQAYPAPYKQYGRCRMSGCGLRGGVVEMSAPHT